MFLARLLAKGTLVDFGTQSLQFGGEESAHLRNTFKCQLLVRL
jgi:hypothetical protein